MLKECDLVLTQVLQVHSDLVHPSSLRLAEHHAGVGNGVEAQSLEHGGTVLAFGRHLADADLVAHHFDWLLAFNLIAGEDNCIQINKKYFNVEKN